MPRKSIRKKKDKVLHTRVPGEVEAALRRRAEELRVPLSSLIRNILEDTLHFVDNVVSDSLAIAETVRKDALQVAKTSRQGAEKLKSSKGQTAGAISRPKPDLQGIVGWQELILERRATCTFCRAPLHRGSQAMIGIGAKAQTPLACLPCFVRRVTKEGDTKKLTYDNI